MGRLFWKFFGAFWIGLVCAAGLIAGGIGLGRWTGLIDPSPSELLRASFTLDAANALLRAGHLDVLQDLGRMSARSPHGRSRAPYVFDESGADLLGKPVPAGLWARVRDAPDDPDLARSLRGIGAQRHIGTADGRRYVVLVPAESGGGLLAAPPPAWLAVAAIVVVGVVFGGLSSWYVVRPIRSLRWALGRVAAGQFGVRVRPLMGRRRDELSALGDDVDRMSQQLHDLVSAQQRLLHDVSHELRSPLARMQAAVEIARQQPERAPAMLDRVERETDRLDSLVGEVLTLARLESGAPLPGREQADATELLAEICADARFEAVAAQRDLSFACSVKFPTTLDVEMIYRAFENVVRNAVKYTAQGSCVRVEAGVADDALVVTVTDAGPGVPDAARQRIFEPFQRLGGSAQDGFGLGLAIARRAIEAHGGHITAAPAPGGGLRVRITLPG